MTSAIASPAPDEGELVARARRGDLDAFESLYHRTAGRVFAICLRMSGDRSRATELLQDVFVRVWERLESFRGDAAFTSWLHRLAVNVVLEQARGERRRVARVGELPEDLEAEELGDRGGSASDVASRMDLETAIARLPAGARRVFVLYAVEGYRHEEIARVMGVAEGTVRAQLHRARKLLMEVLDR